MDPPGLNDHTGERKGLECQGITRQGLPFPSVVLLFSASPTVPLAHHHPTVNFLSFELGLGCRQPHFPSLPLGFFFFAPSMSIQLPKRTGNFECNPVTRPSAVTGHCRLPSSFFLSSCHCCPGVYLFCECECMRHKRWIK